jgi:rhamnosyltransferase
MTSSEFFNNVLFVIVVYEKKLHDVPVLGSLQGLTNSSPSIFIYDNSLHSQPIEEGKIFYHHDPENSGVGPAYNRAFDLAKRLKKTWMLLMDQDSHLSPEALSEYPTATSLYPKQHVFVPLMIDGAKIISPYVLRLGRGKSPRKIPAGILSFSQYYIINSGTLISSDAFNQVGGYDEDFPLDFSDVVFCDRLRNAGFSFVLINAAGSHNLSATDTTQSMERIQTRFKTYANALRKYKVKHNERLQIAWPLLTRGLRLAVHHREFIFLKLAFQNMISRS